MRTVFTQTLTRAARNGRCVFAYGAATVREPVPRFLEERTFMTLVPIRIPPEAPIKNREVV